MQVVITEIKEDVKEIKAAVNELVKQGAIHNHILNEHSKTVEDMGRRIAPLEQDLQFRTKLVAWGGGLLSLAAAIGGIYLSLK